MQNGFIERFNRSYRQAVLDMYVFQTLNEVREQTETWIKEYNEERPHEALGNQPPADSYIPSGRPFPRRLLPLEYPGHTEVRLVSTESGRSFHAGTVNLPVLEQSFGG